MGGFLLVGGVKRKSGWAGPARDVYVSPLWRYRREYAERLAVPWFILSAKHGLLAPDTHIDLTIWRWPICRLQNEGPGHAVS